MISDIKYIETDENTVLCKDCKHMVAESASSVKFAKCAKTFRPGATCLVTGEVTEPSMLYCSTSRSSGSSDLCGAEGKFWVPREEKFLFVAMKRLSQKGEIV